MSRVVSHYARSLTTYIVDQPPFVPSLPSAIVFSSRPLFASGNGFLIVGTSLELHLSGQPSGFTLRPHLNAVAPLVGLEWQVGFLDVVHATFIARTTLSVK